MQNQRDKKLTSAAIVLGLIVLILLGACIYAGILRHNETSSKDLSSVTEESSSTHIVKPAEADNDTEESYLTEDIPAETDSLPTEEDIKEDDPSAEIAPEDDIIDFLLSSMSIEEKIGQMIMARFPTGEDAAYYAETYHLGGYVLFDPDFAGYSEDEVREKLDACQEAASIPLLLSVDEEGGTVTRVSDYYRESLFLSPRRAYEEGGFDLVDEETRERCELLLSLHLNMNLAPVADISGDPSDFMYDRSFGDDLKLTGSYLQRTIAIMSDYGVACSLKHFPGYGNNLDTHVGMSVDDRTIDEFYSADLLAFRAGIQAGAGTIMVSHNIVNCFDEEYPASLSPRVHQVARELGFEGVLLTDDLAMGAIVDYYGTEEAAVLAVQAGNDMLITSSFITQYNAIINAVEDGTISEERLNESVTRILRLKIQMGLL